jgi:hypothetical protein
VIVALLVARMALAGVFVVAGAAKLADLPAAQVGAAGLGVPRAVVGIGVPALAAFEALVGAGLVPPWSSRYAAVAGAVAVLGLTAVAGHAIRRGRRPACGCFGSLGSGLIGPASLVRNAIIVAASALVAAAGRADPRAMSAGWADQVSAITITGLVLLALLAVVTAGLERSNGRLRAERDAAVARLARPAAGQGNRNDQGAAAQPLLPIQRAALPVDQVMLRTAEGRAVPLRESLGPASLAVFVRPECGFSRRLLPELAAARPLHAPALVVICHGDPRDLGLDDLPVPVLADPTGTAGAALGARGTPAAVLTRAGRPAGAAVAGAESVLALARGETPVPRGCGCGTPRAVRRISDGGQGRAALVITKDLCTYTTIILRQDKILRAHRTENRVTSLRMICWVSSCRERGRRAARSRRGRRRCR